MGMGGLLVTLTVVNPRPGEKQTEQRNMDTAAAASVHAPQAAKRKTWKSYLTFLSKFQNKTKHKIKPDAKAPAAFKQQRSQKRYGPVLEECSNMVRVVRRTAASCFAAAMASGVSEDELPSYAQLDQVSYGVKREAFGPIYLVT